MFQKIVYLMREYKKISVAILMLALIPIAYFMFFPNENVPPEQPPKMVEVEKVTLKDISQTAKFIGTIKAQQSAMLVAKAPGILNRLVDSGQKVKKGEAIAIIENKEIEQNYKLSQEAEQIAKQQYDRLNQLLSSGVSSKNAVEEKKSIWLEYQKRMSDAKIAWDEMNIYAPFDGIVGIFKIQEGAQVQEGDPIVNFYDPSSMTVEFDVPVSIVNSVHDGNPVFINKQQYALTHIQRMLDEETHMCPAYVKIQCELCIIGSTLDVDLVVAQKKSVIVIPYEAVFLQEGKTFVYLVKDGKAALTPVTLGIREKEVTEITSGLKQGDVLILRGQSRLYPEAAVEISS